MVLNPPVLGKAWPLFRDPLLAKPRVLLSGFFSRVCMEPGESARAHLFWGFRVEG